MGVGGGCKMRFLSRYPPLKVTTRLSTQITWCYYLPEAYPVANINLQKVTLFHFRPCVAVGEKLDSGGEIKRSHVYGLSPICKSTSKTNLGSVKRVRHCVLCIQTRLVIRFQPCIQIMTNARNILDIRNFLVQSISYLPNGL